MKVDQLVSRGEIAGEFDAEGVQLSGTVKDNTVIRAKTLEVKLAPATEGNRLQVIFGEVALDVGDAPTRDANAGKGGKKGKDKGARRPTTERACRPQGGEHDFATASFPGEPGALRLERGRGSMRPSPRAGDNPRRHRWRCYDEGSTASRSGSFRRSSG